MYYCKDCNVIGYGNTYYNHMRRKHTLTDLGLVKETADNKNVSKYLNKHNVIDLSSKTPAEILEIYTVIKKEVTNTTSDYT